MSEIVDFKDVIIEKLSAGLKTDSFDCGDDDINNFLKCDALVYQQKKLAVTLVFHFKEEIIGFFCCSGDSIRLRTKEKEDGKLDNKRIREFPAVKIGRIGRCRKYRGQKLGEKILDWAIGYIESISEKIGVRFITLDSYPNRVVIYEKTGFKKNLHKDYSKRKHVSMRFDLI